MSLVTNAVNVAGSIGGLAQAASNLASLIGFQTGSWLDSLQPASYGNVPFAIESVRTVGGRRYSVHTYPFRDDNWVEDIGKRARQFEVLGFLVEDDLLTRAGPVVAQRQSLLDICENDGTPKTFVHPTLGVVKSVNCLSVETVERKDLGRVFEIRLTLIVSGPRRFPTTQTSTTDDSVDKASQLNTSSLSDFVKSVASDIQAGAAVVQQAVSTAVGWYQLGVTAVNDVKRIIGAVSTLYGNFGRLFGGGNSGFSSSNATASPSTTASDLLAAATAARANVQSLGVAFQTAAANPSDSATLGAAAQAYVVGVAAAANDPGDAIRLVSGLATFTPSNSTPPGPVGAAMASMQTALGALLRRTALAQLAVCVTTYQPSSQNDAYNVLASVVDLFDSEIDVAGDAGDDASYLALRALRQAVYADLNARGADLAVVATFSFNSPLPALALANRIYRDATRADQLVQQIQPIHPGFCAREFSALAS